MRLAELTQRLLSLAEVIHRWLGTIAALDAERREKLAVYAIEIARTLARAADAVARLEAQPADAEQRRNAMRELGRISGYVETFVAALEHHLDGRKLAGIKRRLAELDARAGPEADMLSIDPARARADRLLAAEGYFRALADGLRA